VGDDMDKTRRDELKSRLSRLAESGLCPPERAAACGEELRAIAKELCDDTSIRRSSRILKTISDPNRHKMIRLLSLRSMCVCEIMAALDMTQSVASHHLQLLENAGVLTKKRKGKWIFYKIADSTILTILDDIASLKTID
jgi:DNA-binding transcriptional ArsR family regulator